MDDLDQEFERLESGEARTPAPVATAPMAPARPKPILTFSTLLPDRETFAVDGKDYEIARYHDLTLHRHAKFGRVYDRALDIYGDLILEGSDALTPEETDALNVELDEKTVEATGMVVRKCPKSVIAKLAIENRIEICRAFQQAVARWRRGQGSPPTTDLPTGDESSTPSPPASDEDLAGGSSAPASANSLQPTGD